MVTTLELLKVVRSRLDATVKYVFISQGQVVEFSYIDKADGKHIICVPTQTACRLGCKFCHLTGLDIPARNLTPDEIVAGIDYVIRDLRLVGGADRCLLISYMGCGEPLANIEGVIKSADAIRKAYAAAYGTVRFAVATLVPKIERLQRLTGFVKTYRLPVKLHLSLHSPFDAVRSGLMPAAAPVGESLEAVRQFMKGTGNSAEIHYALIDGVNDRDADADELVRLLRDNPISVKFLAYNEKPGLELQRSQRIDFMRARLKTAGIPTEYYLPPGSDVGSSCGQFLTEHYQLVPLGKK